MVLILPQYNWPWHISSILMVLVVVRIKPEPIFFKHSAVVCGVLKIVTHLPCKYRKITSCNQKSWFPPLPFLSADRINSATFCEPQNNSRKCDMSQLYLPHKMTIQLKQHEKKNCIYIIQKCHAV